MIERLRGALGPALFDRVLFLPRMDRERYLLHLSVADAVLDAPAYGGEFTGADALWAGVPVVALEGRVLVQRYNAARQRVMGLERFGFPSVDGRSYTALAARLGRDGDFRREVGVEIRARRGMVLNRRGVLREYEEYFGGRSVDFQAPLKTSYFVRNRGTEPDERFLNFGGYEV